MKDMDKIIDKIATIFLNTLQCIAIVVVIICVMKY